MSRKRKQYGELFKPCTASDHEKRPHNCLENPNCLYGLGEFKKGIWQSRPSIFKRLRTNPAEYVRDLDGSIPCGLRNRGATCYLNSMLQCLFMSLPFRKAVYQWTPKKHCPKERVNHMLALQRVFMHLEYGKKSFYDPKELSNTLALNESIQQDVQEFNKLLLTHFETIFHYGSAAGTNNIVSELYCGQMDYVTTCQACKMESRNPSTFYELELPIQNHKSIQECVQGYVQHELLEEENMYFCNTCQSKQNATRQIQFQSFPPVLTLQLMRFVYDIKTYSKKKVQDAILLESELNLSDIATIAVDGPNQTQTTEMKYRLMAVLNHKGTSTHVGHYTAEIRQSNGWFEFDDELVTKQTKKENAKRNVGLKSKNAYMLIYHRIDDDHSKERVAKTLPSPGLMKEVEDMNEQIAINIEKYHEQVQNLEEQIEERKSLYHKYFVDSRPFVENQSKEYCWINRQWLQSWIQGERIENSLDHVAKNNSSVVHDLTGTEDEEEFHASNPSLKLYHEEIDLTTYLCPHNTPRNASDDPNPKLVAQFGSFHPKQVKEMKRIPQNLFQFFKSTYGLHSNLVLDGRHFQCHECMNEDRNTDAERKTRMDTIEDILKFIGRPPLDEATLLEDAETEAHYYISRKFISAQKLLLTHELQSIINQKKSLIKRSSKSYCSAEAMCQRPLNEDIVCEHKNCVASKRRLRIIPQSLWLQWKNQSIAADPVLYEFPLSLESSHSIGSCAICDAADGEAKESVKKWQQEREKMFEDQPEFDLVYHRKAGHFEHRSSSTAEIETIPANEWIYLAPAIWLTKWRSSLVDHHQHTSLELPQLSSAMFLCSEHQKIQCPLRIQFLLAQQQQIFTSSRWKEWTDSMGDFPDAELMSEEEWTAFTERFNVGDNNEKAVGIAFQRIPSTKVSSKDPSQVVWKIDYPASVAKRRKRKTGTAQRCADCEQRLQELYQEAQLNYEHQQLSIRILRPEQAIPENENHRLEFKQPSLSDASLSSSSHRRRRTKSTQTVDVHASSSDHILLLKYKIMERTNYAPSLQELYFEGRVLDDGLTLMQAKIPASGILYVRILHAEKSGDVDFILPVAGREEVEEGFRGSVFSTSMKSDSSVQPLKEKLMSCIEKDSIDEQKSTGGGWICSRCTFHNVSLLIDFCSMCDHCKYDNESS